MADVPATLASVYFVAGILDRLELPYAFIGGVALNSWAVPRATFDLDLALSIPPDRVGQVLEEFHRAGAVVDAPFARGFRDRVGGMEKIHFYLPAGSSLMAVDVFLATTPFLESVLDRRVKIDLGQGSVWVCTAADLVLFKLLADRKKDGTDVENVISVQGVPEREYLVRWAEVLGVGPRLDAVLQRHR